MRIFLPLAFSLCFALSQNLLLAQQTATSDAGQWMTRVYDLAPATTWQPRGIAHVDADGVTHAHLTQHFRGLPVLGGDVAVHTDPGGRRTVSGRPLGFDVAETTPHVDPARATRAATWAWARASTPARSTDAHGGEPPHRDRSPAGGWAVPTERLGLASADANAARLVLLDAAYPRRSGAVRLAYEVTVDVPARHERHAYYVDAASAQVITSVPLLCHASVPGHGETTYYGRQSMALDSVAPSRLLLRDGVRGGNVVRVQRGYQGQPTVAEATSRDVTASLPAEAADVAYGTAAFYDMMAERFGWLGIDGAGAPLEAVVFEGDEGQFVNAYWDGTTAAFGNGGCHYGPLTTVDVVGHEYLHGITDYTSDLVYRGESGALNEAMSDIFGKSLERLTHPNTFSWELGNGFADSEYARGFRSMSDPHAYEDPAVYGGAFWHASNGVHTNSSVLNHWFYLLVEGGTGVNDLGTDYDVRPLGLDTALAHVFSLQRDYLVSTSTYREAYAYSLEIAEAAFARTSDEYRAIEQAWRAVGFGAESSGDSRDIAVVGLSYYTDPCQLGEPLTLELWMSNLGDSIVPAGTELTFAIDIADGAYAWQGAVGVVEAVPPGSTFPLPLATDIVIDEANYFDVALELLTPDDDDSNNRVDDYFRLSDSAEEALLVFGDVIDEGPCVAGDLSGYLYISNDGCRVAPARAYRFNYVTEDGDVIGGFSIDIATLEPGDFRYLDDVPFDRALLSEADDVSLQLGDYPAYDDERLYISYKQPPTLATSTTIAFDNVADLDILVPDMGSYTWLDIGIVERGGQIFWGSTGSEYVRLETPPCPEVADLFLTSGTAGRLACVDFSAYDAPATVSLEAMHQTSTRSDIYAELSDHYGAISVSYDDIDGRRVRFTEAGLTEDVPRALSFELPVGYVGPIRIETYNHHGDAGRRYLSDAVYDTEFDFTFVRNVAVSAEAVNVSEVEVRSLALAPNPATEVTRLTLPTTATAQLRVVDFLGRLVYEETFTGGATDVSVAAWPTGVYAVEARVEGEAVRYAGRLAR